MLYEMLVLVVFLDKPSLKIVEDCLWMVHHDTAWLCLVTKHY